MPVGLCRRRPSQGKFPSNSPKSVLYERLVIGGARWPLARPPAMMGQAPGRKDERPPLSEHSLAPYGNRVIRPPEDAQRTNRKRLISWLLVALVHGFFIALLTANFIKQEKVGEKGPIETFFDLSVMHNPSLAPPVTMIKPEVENANPPEVSTA